MQDTERPRRDQPSPSEDSRYRLLVEAVTDYAICMLSPDGAITSWNSGARRFTGYHADEIIGAHFSRFYTDADKRTDLPMQALQIARDDGRFEGEGWRVRKDGTRYWAHVAIDPIRDSGGGVIGFAQIIRDLSDRKRAAEELRRTEEQFRILVQGVTDYAIYMLDPHGRITNWNAGAERLKGYRPEEIIGEHFSRFYGEEERAAGAPDANLRIAASEGRFEKEGWRFRKDGSRFWANVVIDPIRNEAGELIDFAKITRDFTERRAAQKALEETREALFQAQKMESLGQLTGGVAHNFNNILMAIQSSLALIRRRLPADPRTAQLLDNALQAASRGATLTQRMLVFARRQKLNPEPTDLPALVQGMSGLLQRTLTPAFRLETRFPIGLPLVMVDPNQLESALLNLTINARDAMPEGGLIVVAARAEKTPAGMSVCLSVTDSGEGMDEETRQRAVEPFFTTKGVGKGTGLGLSMVKGLADESGGRLEIKSRIGAGTTVEIWLPAGAGAPRPKGEPVVEEPASTRALTVLAVDDDPLVLLNTQAMLEDLGHEVLTAPSGAQALQVLEQQGEVDLLLTDQAMPHMTGTQLAAIARARWPRMRILIASGYAEAKAEEATGLPRLAKPYLETDLARALASLFEKAPAEG